MIDLSLAKTIDHALLKPDLTREEVVAGCALARECEVFSVCVKPCDIELATELLSGSSVLVGTVIGFPHGGQTSKTKGVEASDAVERGAQELDMVINIAALTGGEFQIVERDIRAVVSAAGGKLVKVILETSYLSDQQIQTGCRIAEQSGAQFVKTSTGFSSKGATIENVRLMRATVGPSVQVKASGAIRTKQDAFAMLEAGATRLGTTASASIVYEKADEGSDSSY